MHRCLSADVFSEKQIVLRKQSSGKTVSFDEQKTFKENLKSIGGYGIYYLSIVFRKTRDLPNIGAHNSGIPSFSHSHPEAALLLVSAPRILSSTMVKFSGHAQSNETKIGNEIGWTEFG